MSPTGRPPDDRDAVKNVARDLSEAASQLGHAKGTLYAWLKDPKYGALGHRLEDAHAAVEAALVEAKRRVRLDEEDGR